MKILSIGNFTTGWDGSICDEEHIAQSLERLGHKVIRQQRDTGWDAPLSNVDVALVAQWDGYPEDAFDWPIPIVYWAFDYQNDDQEWHQRLIKKASLYLSKPFKDAKYENWHWLSQDFAPNFLDAYKPTIQGVTPEKDIDVLFTGSWVPWESGKQRVEILKAIDEKFNLQINSVTPEQWKAEGFKNVQGPVMDHDLPALIARAKINFSMDHVIAEGYWSDRNAQIMACGGLVLFHYVPFSEAIFKNNVIYFYNKEDCLERITRLLEVPQEDRDMVAYAGYTHARRNMMAIHRTQDLLTLLKAYL